jgi:hypothetical protein
MSLILLIFFAYVRDAHFKLSFNDVYLLENSCLILLSHVLQDSNGLNDVMDIILLNTVLSQNQRERIQIKLIHSSS